GVGFVVDVKGRKSHDIVRKGIEILVNLEHRGACGCEKNTGDGAGILVQTPHRFLSKAAAEAGIRLPEPGAYGAGLVFLPTDAAERERCEKTFERIIADEGQQFLGWRTVPVENSTLGPTAQAAQPVIRQVFVGAQARGLLSVGRDDGLAFERKLYVIRRRVENAVKTSDIAQRNMFYVPSLSCKTLVYKGMLISTQLTEFYPDLRDPAVESALAMVHSRFSTN